MDAKIAKVRAEEDALEEAEKAKKTAEGEKDTGERAPEVDGLVDVLATLEVVRRAIAARAAVQPRLLVHVLDVHNSVEKSLEVSTKPKWFQMQQKNKNELEPEAKKDPKARLMESSALVFWGTGMSTRVSPFTPEDSMQC
ncbi:predicted protein [Postia placenta Mad-698-R]|nr:predicted protein [Postia placenta Mad-698-R]